MYISIVSLHVDDIDRAVEFYTSKLGWKITMDVPMGEDRWVTIQPPSGQAQFTLSTTFAASDDSDGMSGVILEVDDVVQAHEQLTKAGVDFVQPPQAMPWGGWAMFRDSEGNVHGLHSPVTANVGA